LTAAAALKDCGVMAIGNKTHKPRLFVGSSSEGIQIARSVEVQLSDVAEVTLWKDGPFGLNSGSLQALVRASSQYDFAVLVLTPDDVITSRDVTSQAPRDNVMFELGLFMGRLGLERCFAMVGDDPSVKLPSDLAGVTLARFQSARGDANWLSAVSPACTLIRNEILRVGGGSEFSASCEHQRDALVPVNTAEPQSAANEVLAKWGLIPNDWIEFGDIRKPKTGWFHEDRFCKAFPGVRGVSKMLDAKVAVERLRILLRRPLEWLSKQHEGVRDAPIWWWRGFQNNPIKMFDMIRDNLVLRDEDELQIQSVVAVNAGAYWQSFVYVEASATEPSGVYEYEANYIDNRFSAEGPVHEEYGEWRGRKITRAEYDDGAAVIDGVPQRTADAELRVRYLTPYNFLIAAQDSPINNKAFDLRSEQLMNGILRRTVSIEELVSAILKLPKRGY
jgi:predicted nucleotide-binding protein